MTERPRRLPDRPNRATDDALTELFRAVRFTRTLYYTVDVAVPWPSIQVPQGGALRTGLGARARNVLSYHLVLEGACWTGLESGTPVRLERGDVVVFPRGDPYFLAHAIEPRPPPSNDGDGQRLSQLLDGVASGALPPRVVAGPSGGERTRFVCGFLGCDPRPFDPLLDALPPLLHLRGVEGRLKRLVDLALAEVEGSGSASVRERLSESMFIETVRLHLADAPPSAGWLAGLRDPIVARALALLHARPAHGWTLASLAKQTGASRSALAERFTKCVGHPPMQYLTRWRMQTAALLLERADVKLIEVASEVGYESQAAFSRAFKKATGLAPAAFREARLGGD